jgi:lipoprotein-anchoring transpeptidase ErfK/SrfK
VLAFQRARSLPADGVVGPMTTGALSGRIVIDQSDHLLTLYRPGQATLQFPVAVGQSAYPTPIGDFTVITMVRDPTWVPPDAEWAQGALPVPPGPDNPLGTRWIGISAPAVGIHGTPDPESIGYSVSHGCIRMRIPDVELVFELVSIGTPVHIQA